MLAGKTPREAWELANKPGGEAGIQNIRWHVKQLRKKAADGSPTLQPPLATESPLATEPPLATQPLLTPTPKNNERAPYRRSSTQVDKQYSADQTLKRAYTEALKLASLELKEAQVKGQTWAAGGLISGESLANYRVFYEVDGELLNQSLYPNTYGRNSSSAIGSWMIIAGHSDTLTGAICSCTWSQGVLQQAITLRLGWLDSSLPAGTLIAALGAAGLTILADGAVAAHMRPAAAAEAAETCEALSIAIERCSHRFSLEMPQELAARRAEAFRMVAAAWQREEAQRTTRDEAASACRCLIAAATYAASGGSIYAPVVASMGVVAGFLVP
eukprot:CAMPEP_0174741142 /NCGR_PEP_ID=MMETSP1094-20130205/75475_1 /TAXON_ID=156173 /ORGANISM="Chrysochromulina brevifilum, Strain UTEX LB 985" /LENGTH=329 /DNA_ID=CAMNT_0015944969 /DNA_START=170 /DNA_END=1159 /DNA_ORIENTATION=+